MMGSGGLIVMDETTCMVDIAKFFLEFTVDESCGKCTPCRVGTKRLLEILNKITSGKGTLEDIDKLEELCYYIKENSLCGLGQNSAEPGSFHTQYYVMSTLRTSPSIVARQAPARPSRITSSMRTSARAARSAHATARSALSPAPSASRTSSIRRSASSAASAVKSAKFGAIEKK